MAKDDDTWDDLRKRGFDELPRDVLLPVGSYLLRGRGAKYNPARGDANPTISFAYGVREPMDDVDDKELQKALGPNGDVSSKRVFYRIWLETGADWDAVRNHLAKHGVKAYPTAEGGLEKSLEAFKGTEAVAYLDHRNYTNKAGELVTENNPTQFHKAE